MTRLALLVSAVLTGAFPLPAKGEVSPQALPLTLVSPSFLPPQEKIPDKENLKFPRPPQQDFTGSPLAAKNLSGPCPWEAPFTQWADSSLQEVLSLQRSENDSKKYFWHTWGGWNYCHHRENGRDWYGWKTGSGFHWVLLQNGRFWWHDSYAERWLYFYKGYWWWQSQTARPQAQVYLEDGHYHVCDADGTLGEDMWTTGVAEVVTEPVKKEESYEATPGKERRVGPRGGMDKGMGEGGGLGY